MRSALLPLLAGALLAPLAARAQTAALDSTAPSRGTLLPPTSAALADEAHTALTLNPAGLGNTGAIQAFYVHERSINRGQTADGLYLADGILGIGLGFSTDWVRGGPDGDYRKTNWGLSFGTPLLSLGASYAFYASETNAALDKLGSVGLGLLFRPVRGLSIGLSAQNVDAQEREGLRFDRQYDIGVAVRPFGERFTLAVDYLQTDARIAADGLLAGRLAYTVQAEVLRGMTVSGGFTHGLRAGDGLGGQLALTLDLPNVGLTYAGGLAEEGTDHVIALRLSSQRYRGLSMGNGKVALLDLADALSAPSGLLAGLLGAGTMDPFIELIRTLDAASHDPELRGLVVKIDGVPAGGLGTVEELRAALFRFRAAGKKVVAVLLTATDRDYLLATAADRIYALPESMLLVNGLSASTIFLGGTMEKLDVSWDVARVGAYKNAPDQLTRTEMSKEQREAIDAYLDADVRAYEGALRDARKLTPAKIQELYAIGLPTSRRAVELGLVDEVITPAQLDDRLQDLLPGARFDPEYSVGGKRPTRWGSRRRIAIVPVIGNIAGGKSRSDPLGAEAIAGAETVVKALKAAEEDPSVAAIVVRVDSGGGDGLASDLMYRAVLEAKKVKPVVASMGDVAASGGYYAAMGADEVFASATTITGSIGVFVVKPALEGLAKKLGVNQQTIQRAPLTELIGGYAPWTPEEKVAAQRWVDAFYDDFITEVAASRKLAKPAVDAVARGRVWAGEDAKARGLIDTLGGLSDALASAKKRAGVGANEELEVVVYGEAHGLLSSPGGEEGVKALAHATARLLPAPALPEGLLALADRLGVLPSALLFQPGVKAMLEYRLTVQ